MVSKRVINLEQQAYATRDVADEEFLAKAQLVINGVLADQTKAKTARFTKQWATLARANAKAA
jgi:hypothetical protein